MKALFGNRRIWLPAIALITIAALAGCTTPKPHHPPKPSPTPSKSKGKVTPSPKGHGQLTPKPSPAPKPTPAPLRFTQDPAGNQLQKLVSTPAGQAKLRTWMNANGLPNEAIELFIRADIYAPQRKKAAAALAP